MEEKLSGREKKPGGVEEMLSGRENDFAWCIDHFLELPEKDWTQYSPLTLAWIGDTVYDLMVRTALLKRGNVQTAKLHKKATGLVNARSQAAVMERILPDLTKEEASVYRRGRNSSPAHKAKNADRDEYLKATGFECLIGYLYLTGRYRRILELAGEELLPERP